jgi:hypothetical protein
MRPRAKESTGRAEEALTEVTAVFRQCRPMMKLLAALALSALSATGSTAREGDQRQPRGYDLAVLPEPAADREARHRRMAEHRAQAPLIICHRGASAFAPENTLEAYAAAMDYGADGCEVDIRKTRDGVLVLFHDDMLDHLTTGLGTVDRFSYYELLQMRPRRVYGTANWETRLPTFASLLSLARQRDMLLHLDVKQTGLDADLRMMLTDADAWDHVAGINTTTAPELAKDPRFKPLHYKGPGLFEDHKDLDPESVRAQLALPGDAIMVDDPRFAVHELQRTACHPVAVPDVLRERFFGSFPDQVSPAAADHDPFVRATFSPLISGRRLDLALTAASSPLAETYRLEERTDPEHRNEEFDRAGATPPDGETRRIDRDGRLVLRAAAAQAVADRGDLHAPRREWLEFQVKHRTLHKDWLFHGLDGAIAARALGTLGSVKSVPLLVATFKRADPELEKVVNHSFGPYPLSWTDFRMKMHIIPALGALRCPESKQALLEYLRLDDKASRERGPDYRSDAVEAVFNQKLTRAEIEELLRSPHTAIRGTAILQCLDYPTPDRTAALRATAAWALELPHAAK